jgi:2,3-bisphosphoglycerate-independent phosphoglycerate mutase
MELNQNKVFLFFVDGLGIGEPDPEKNPCASPDIKLLNHFIGEKFPKTILMNGFACSLDAALGVPGLPQSATGQTTLLTGHNAAKLLGYHLPGFPNEKLRRLIYDHSILKKIRDAGKTGGFINAYTPLYFKYGPEKLRKRLSVTSHATLASGFQFFNLDDVRQERSIYQEFTNQSLIEKGHQLPVYSPEKAGQILAQAIQQLDFSLYEYFQTDRAGHSGNWDFARGALLKIEQLLLTVLSTVNLSGMTIIFTSDHGNIEDLSVRTHTRNPAMTLIWGYQAEILARRLQSIENIAAEILQLLNIQKTK